MESNYQGTNGQGTTLARGCLIGRQKQLQMPVGGRNELGYDSFDSCIHEEENSLSPEA